jgi:dynein heavy chain
MVVFIDDISMPEVNTWGDQITLEIVRQLIEYSGFYNLAKPGEWKSVVDISMLACMLTPGGGKNDIPNRAKRHFHVINVTLPSAASINQIFGSMVRAVFAHANLDVSAAAEDHLVGMTAEVWQRVKAKMLPTPAKFHYIFNLRDLSRVFQVHTLSPGLGPSP